MPEVIDFHCHVFPEAVAAKATNNVGSYYGINMQGKGLADELKSAKIRAEIPTDAATATVVLALFEDAQTLKTVLYASDVTVADGKATAEIDLSDENVAGCILKAFLWSNDTLKPILEVPYVLD